MDASIGSRSPGTSAKGREAGKTVGRPRGEPDQSVGTGQILAWPGRQHPPEVGAGRFLEGAIAALEQQIRARQILRPTDFLRLGLAIVPLRESGFILTGRYENRVEIRVRPAAPSDAPTEAGLRWDVVGAWHPDRQPAVHTATIDEWLGLPFADAFALVRGLINEVVSESRGTSAVTDCFTCRGRTILNPSRDAFGNETSPASEYGESYSAWRARSPFLPRS